MHNQFATNDALFERHVFPCECQMNNQIVSLLSTNIQLFLTIDSQNRRSCSRNASSPVHGLWTVRTLQCRRENRLESRPSLKTSSNRTVCNKILLQIILWQLNVLCIFLSSFFKKPKKMALTIINTFYPI